jgi:ABC-2 type transport system ATP-binding protein
MAETIVEVKNLCVQFGSFLAVKNVSFAVSRGEIFGFLGANGAGKTTTIRVICGLIHATSGEVTVDGEHFVKGRENVIKSKVGYMSQRFTLYNDLTVKENLDFAATLHRIPSRALKIRKEELYSMIKFDRSEDVIVNELPSGVKQQVALVGALIHDPSLVVLDEPTAGVSPIARMKFWELIRVLTSKGKTVFVTTHYMDEAENCDRVLLMRSGELIAIGSPTELKEQTFSKRMYRLLPKEKLDAAQVKRLNEICDMITPYGRAYHVVFIEDSIPAWLEEKFYIEEFEPSLEDVFIRNVEGDR